MQEIKDERKVICTIFSNEFDHFREQRDDNIGKIQALFEIHTNGEISPINSIEMFCETEQAFVTGGFSDIKERFGQRLFEATCIKSERYEVGKCQYITRSEYCQAIRGLQVTEVISENLPDVNNPVITSLKKPLINNILIENNGYVYGPFDYEEDQVKNTLNIKPVTATSNYPNLDTYYIAKFSSTDIEPFIKRINERIFVGSMKKLALKIAEKIDFISDDAIINMYGGKFARSGAIRNFTKNTIRLISSNCCQQRDYQANKARYHRLSKAMNDANKWTEEQTKLIIAMTNTDDGKNIIGKYIDKNKELYFQAEKKSYLEKLNIDTKKEIDELNRLKKEKDALEKESKRLAKENLEIANNAVSLNINKENPKKNINENVKVLSEEEERLNKKLDELQTIYSQLKTLKKIDDEISYKKRNLKELEREENQLNDSISNTSDRLKASNEELRDRLIGMKPEVDALCGITTIKRTKNYNFSTKIIEDIPALEEFVNLAQNNLNSLGRNYDYNSVANILTTIAQTQFTLFSGLPGTGKTSFVKLLGEALGIEQRMLNIPVARGWTSSRDSLGFFNALSQSYTPASNGLYELISELNEEVIDNQKESTVSIVLLDEFNLSQPEHYFSPFMEMADKESKRVIVTGDNVKPLIRLPEYLKFIGTINQDESVQSLTPRMLDRAAIINFNDLDINYDVHEKNKESLTPLNIKGSDFIRLFSSGSKAMPDSEEKIIANIANALKDQNPKYGIPIILSYRKINAIRNYFNVASPLMFPNQFLALDLAITQHIVPLLNGYGESFQKRLEFLLTTIPEDMENSSTAINRIIEYGKINMLSFGDFL